MEKTAKKILEHRRAVILLFVALALLGGIMSINVRVNYSLTDYLPKEANSTIALSLMESEFHSPLTNARLMLKNVTLAEALEYKQQLAEIAGVSGVMWLDDVVDLAKPLEIYDADTVAAYYKDGNALITLAIEGGSEVRIIDSIYELTGSMGALDGDAVTAYSAQKLAVREVGSAMLILVPMITIILLLSTTSWLEPLLYFAAIGVAVLINMGTNLFFGSVSFVTQSVSPILQLAVSLDYAIFLLSSFAKLRHEHDDLLTAMALAMKRAFSAVAASAATTMFGFAALCAMSYTIGADMGLNLLKGIILSFLSVMIFLPALTIYAVSLLDKFSHKRLLPSFDRIGSFILRLRIPVLLIISLLLVPCALAQSRSTFEYGMGAPDPDSRTYIDKTAVTECFGSQVTLAALVPRGDVAREAALIDELSGLSQVNSAIGYANMVGTLIPSEYLDGDIIGQFYSDNYARIVLYLSTKSEGEAAFAAVEEVRGIIAKYYDTSYTCGESANMYDIKNYVTTDNSRVNLLALLAIGLVLLVTFRSLSLPLILILTIETSIWINMSIPYFMGTSFNYLGYLIISTVQLGATVDYAILFADHYLVNRRQLPKTEAITKTLGEVFQSILVSGSILSLSGMALNLTSTNPIVAVLGSLLSRGTLLSMLLVLVFLPAALYAFDNIIAKTTLHSDFFGSKNMKGEENE